MNLQRADRQRLASWARSALLCTSAVLSVAAQADVVDIAWNDRGGFTYEGTIEPGKFAEVCGKVQPGQSIAWRYTADKPLEFNIHYHVGKDVVYPARKTAAASRGKLRIASSEDHCWMWTNKSDAPAALSLKLHKR